MVDYKYNDLYNKPHVDKQMKIIACDFVGYVEPDSKYPAKSEYEGKVYLDERTNFYYKCRKTGFSYSWEKAEHEYELLVFKNSDIDWENFELSESLCSESELRFGCCEASILKFRIHNTFVSLKGKWVTVVEVLDGHTDSPFQFGRYKVFSDVPTADRLCRDVTAYDSMYDIINSSAINWYNTILPNKDSKVTMRQFRTSFVNYFGLEQEEITLVNDDMIVEKTIQVEEGAEIENETEHTSIIKESALNGKYVITSICEINGCFGQIGRNGKFLYIYLNQDIMGLYPSNDLFPDRAPDYLPQAETGHLYPQSPKGTRIGNGTYISADYEDFICRRINKIQIREKENEIGGQYPKEKVENQNAYIIEDNFLVYGKSAEDLSLIAKHILEKITDVVYRPFSAECAGNPCLEVGDPVRLSTKYELIESYILKRVLKGIQSIKDNYSAEGQEKYSEKVNSISKSIIQLKGKTNELFRTAEETRSTITDVEEGLQTEIIQRKDAIKQEARARDELGNEIKATLDVKIDKDDDGRIISLINGSAYKIHFEAKNMFIVDSPNFSVDENGDIHIIGKINMRYKIGNFIPPQYGNFVFAESYTNEGGIPYLRINSPGGTSMIECGQKFYQLKPADMRPYAAETPIFNNGIYAENAVIASLFQDFREFPNFSNGSESIDLRVRVSGAFISLYGGYHAFSHAAGESKTIVIGSGSERFLPTHQAVRAVGFQGKRTFVFVITTDGKFTARNASDIDLNASELTDIKFRFDFFRF